MTNLDLYLAITGVIRDEYDKEVRPADNSWWDEEVNANVIFNIEEIIDDAKEDKFKQTMLS